MSNTIANKLIVTNSLWIISEKGIRLILGILVIGLVARHLGTALFGQLNFSLAVLAVAVVVASVGLNRIVTREVVEAAGNESIRSEIVSTAFFLRLAATIFILALLFTYSYFFLSQNQTLFFLVVASLLFNPFDAIDLHQQGLAQVKGIAVIRSGIFIVASLTKISLVYTEVSAIWFFAFVFIEHALVAVCFYVFIVTRNGRGFLSVKRCKWGKGVSILRESWPEVIAGLGGILFMRLDQIMLQFMQGAESVGIYSAAVRISEAWYFFPIAIISASFPKIIQLRDGVAERYEDAMVILFSGLVGIAAFAILFFLLFSDQIVGLVFGPEFSESALILQVHCLTAVFILMGSASGSWLAAERKLIWNLHRNLFGLVVNIVLNVILIERYGALGAAIATLVSAFSAYYLFDLLSPKLRFMFRIKSQAIFTLGIYGVIRAKKHSSLT
ncbi:flippase [Marinobacter sp.]|uniref:flippase n=1 Tax=Marinobacter sp. TaxID=50741 RepID=UPI002610B90A|nr:flippase [Marinobacter sp.]